MADWFNNSIGSHSSIFWSASVVSIQQGRALDVAFITLNSTGMHCHAYQNIPETSKIWTPLCQTSHSIVGIFYHRRLTNEDKGQLGSERPVPQFTQQPLISFLDRSHLQFLITFSIKKTHRGLWGWWLFSCRGSVAEHWRSVLGSTPGNCQPFHFPHYI